MNQAARQNPWLRVIYSEAIASVALSFGDWTRVIYLTDTVCWAGTQHGPVEWDGDSGMLLERHGIMHKATPTENIC